jgi:hypothetical protein
MNIKLHIEQLVLDGLPITPGQGPIVKAAVEAELTRLVAEGGLGPELASGGAVPSITADSIEHSGGSPTQMGQQIARSLYGGIGR